MMGDDVELDLTLIYDCLHHADGDCPPVFRSTKEASEYLESAEAWGGSYWQDLQYLDD